VSTCRGGGGGRSACLGAMSGVPPRGDSPFAPLDCTHEGVCRAFSTRDLRSVPSLESVGGGELIARDADGLDRAASMSAIPCAREWRLKGVSVTDMAEPTLALHHGDRAGYVGEQSATCTTLSP
jgi:hypothetical protein